MNAQSEPHHAFTEVCNEVQLIVHLLDLQPFCLVPASLLSQLHFQPQKAKELWKPIALSLCSAPQGRHGQQHVRFITLTSMSESHNLVLLSLIGYKWKSSGCRYCVIEYNNKIILRQVNDSWTDTSSVPALMFGSVFAHTVTKRKLIFLSLCSDAVVIRLPLFLFLTLKAKLKPPYSVTLETCFSQPCITYQQNRDPILFSPHKFLLMQLGSKCFHNIPLQRNLLSGRKEFMLV